MTTFDSLKGVEESYSFVILYHPDMSKTDEPGVLAELGYAMYLDKPILVLCKNDRKPLPENLLKVAEKVFYFEESVEEIGEELNKWMRGT